MLRTPQRCRRCDHGGQYSGTVACGTLRHDLLHQSDPPCFLSVEKIAGEQVSLDVPPTDAKRPPHRAATEGEDAALRFGLAQLPSLCWNARSPG